MEELKEPMDFEKLELEEVGESERREEPLAFG